LRLPTDLLGKRAVHLRPALELESALRKTSKTLTAPNLPPVAIRDQHPLHEGRLAGALEGMTVAEWCRELNRRVFFWVSTKKLETFLAAYADAELDVLIVDARALAGGTSRACG